MGVSRLLTHVAYLLLSPALVQTRADMGAPMQNVPMFGAVSRPALVPREDRVCFRGPAGSLCLGVTWAVLVDSGTPGPGSQLLAQWVWGGGTCFTHPHAVQSQVVPASPHLRETEWAKSCRVLNKL